MLMPFASVTAIGLAVGLTAAASGRSLGGRLLQGVVTAWIGFLAGAMAGVTVDVVVGTGVWLALLGHAGALAAAAVGLSARPARREAHA